jgi:hypothetical protein
MSIPSSFSALTRPCLGAVDRPAALSRRADCHRSVMAVTLAAALTQRREHVLDGRQAPEQADP